MATILVMNASGKQTHKVNRNIDVLGTRKAARQKIILETRAKIVLVQESEANIDSFLTRTGRYPTFECIGSKQVAILFHKEYFEMTGCASLRRGISALCDELEKTGIIHSDKEVMTRMCIAQLQMLRNDIKFLFISWSGPLHPDTETRKQVLKDMLTLTDMYMVGKPVYLVIGGEFNLTYGEMVQVLSEFQNLHLCECSKESQYPYKTEYFIVSQRLTSLIGDVHIFDVKSFLRNQYQVDQPDVKQVLCHNPIFLNLHI